MSDNPSGNSPPLPDISFSGNAELRQLGDYRLVERLGAGGMGVVYKAVHAELDRVVALKVLPAGLADDEEAIARFKREIKAVGQLDHPQIVRAYDARKIGQTHFLVMEYVEGTDWEQLIRRLGPLRVADVCELGRQAALGLQHAHEHGLIHRDIKPSNLMLTRQGQVKILDLGLARIRGGAASAALTVSGQTMGTPDYIAPEQACDSHDVDIRADLYSLGCTLYKLLAGRAPFEDAAHGTLYAKLQAHQRESPPPLANYRSDLPRRLVAVLERLLAKDPARRFSTPGELATALAPLAAGSNLPALAASGQTQTVRPSAAPTAVHPQQRRRPWLWIGLGLILGLTALAAGRLFLAQRLTREADHVARHQPAPPSVAEPSPARPLPGWIVLSWTPEAGGKPSLWLFRPDGRQRQRITEDPNWFDVHPAFSPDGRRIAFVRTRPLGSGSGVWVCAADGTRARQLAGGASAGERLVSPVWLSDTELVYVRDPKIDRQPEMELWQVNTDKGSPSRVLSFRDLVPGRGAIVTDVSPDRRQLLVAAQRGVFWATADVYLLDWQERSIHPLWQDPAGDHKDARPLWSPTGRTIAWHHNTTPGALAKVIHYGVALARQQADGGWKVDFQPDQQTFVTPLAWSPDGSQLLCARREAKSNRAQLLLMDEQFQVTQELFPLNVPSWHPEDREFGNLADWALVPADVPVPGHPGPQGR